MPRQYSTFVEGIVVDTNDPQQMGRVKVWCPSVDGPKPDTYDNIPWATYISPFGGEMYDFQAGASEKVAPGPNSYGFWAIPKRGAMVVIGFMYGDINQRFYLGSYYPDHGNRSLPAGRNKPEGPVTNTEDAIEPATSNLQKQFQGDLQASEARTRGAYERQVAQAQTEKDGKEGYQPIPGFTPKPSSEKRTLPCGTIVKSGEGDKPPLDPQTYAIATPGRHAVIMQDNPETGRVRIKTAEGHQIIFDDANERIYVSTAQGGSWLEMDLDGHVHVYGAASFSVAAGEDINFSCNGNFNVQAGKAINMAAGEHFRASACADLSLTGDKGVNLTSGSAFNILASGNLIQTGSNIHLNGPKAAQAECPDRPKLVPDMEPWKRPATKGKRGKHWKA